MLDEKGFKRKRFVDLLSELESKAKEVFGEKINTSERSPLGIILRLFAWGLSRLWQQLENVYNSAHVDTAEGNSLGHVGKYIGIKKRAAEKAKTKRFLITGEPGSPIIKGFRAATKSEVFFETLEETVIPATGQVEVPLQAVVAGASGNVPARTITVIVNPQAGITAVTNLEDTTGGREKEEDPEFRDRYNRSLAAGGSSTTESIIATLLALPGVRDCTCEENTTSETVNGVPRKSIAPLVLGGDDVEIATAILKTKAGGIRSFGETEITVTDSRGKAHVIGFSRPTLANIFVNVALVTDSDFPADGITQVRTRIISYIGGHDEDGTEYDGLGLERNVIYTKIISAIQQVPGIVDMDLKIGTALDSLGKTNITIPVRNIAITSWEKVKVN
ncbi:baseplate J/gp47 family protein [Brevibacillus brevis]|uniref:baseplate J/gp47 family protein n=1 Tax=Brevibacillus brevis TaxID=1393 RepID=UPI00115AC46B|nr:baseplate J/gp47 family protein [Lysinibacillus sp. SDF0063]TQR29383.1 baseplate J/gp47 family protein [Lysinibacillus sp. SDF0063]